MDFGLDLYALRCNSSFSRDAKVSVLSKRHLSENSVRAKENNPPYGFELQ